MSIFNLIKGRIIKKPVNPSSGSLTLSLSQIKTFANTRRNSSQHLCNAPFSSLRFERYGRVLACCHNNSFIAGIYPQQKLSDIWKGEPLTRFRADIVKNKLDSGCRVCYDDIITGNYTSVSALMFDNYSVESGFPSMLDFKIDNTCNLSCVMCFSVSTCQKQSQTFDKDIAFKPYDDNFINELELFIPHLKNVRFSGGEPFLSEYYLKLWQKIHSFNPQCVITVQTNGNVMNNSIKELLDKGVYSINVSLDSLDAEIYQKIRVNGSLEKVLENISFFREYCRQKKTKFGITICPMNLNAGELHRLIEFCNSNNAYAWFSIVWYPIKLAIWNLDAETLSELYDNLIQKTLPEETALEKYNKALYDEFVNNVKLWHSWALRKGAEETVNISTYRDLIAAHIEAYFNKMPLYNKNEIKARKIAYLTKANNIINKCDSLKLPQHAINLLFKYNSTEMFLEILEEENENDILENLKALSL